MTEMSGQYSKRNAFVSWNVRSGTGSLVIAKTMSVPSTDEEEVMKKNDALARLCAILGKTPDTLT
ncbi:MAG TPA: hypothetical protein VJJ22_02440 [Candidatus Paceibacterota bacterium]